MGVHRLEKSSIIFADEEFDSILEGLDSDDDDVQPKKTKPTFSGKMTEPKFSRSSVNEYLRPEQPSNPFSNGGNNERVDDKTQGRWQAPPEMKDRVSSNSTTANQKADESNGGDEDDDDDDLIDIPTEAPSVRAQKKLQEKQQQKQQAHSTSASKPTPLSDSSKGHTVDDWVKEKMTSAPSEREEYATLPEKPATAETDQDGQSDCLRMYWLDMHEDHGNPGTLYIFGKTIVNHDLVHKGDPQGWASVCLQVNNLERCMFVLPRDKSSDGSRVGMMDVYQEIKQEVDKVLPRSEGVGFKSKRVWRKYAFELLDVPHGNAEYLKVAYPAKYPSLPDTSGKTFSRIFGTRTSCMENFVLKRDLMGPCWIEVKSASIQHLGVSWCKYEAFVDNPKNISALRLPHEKMPPIPPLAVASISLKTMVNPESGSHEVVMASIIAHSKVSAEGPTHKSGGNIHYVTAICQPNRNTPLPVDFKEELSSIPPNLRENLRQMPNERALLSFILAWIVKMDPDVLVGHNIKGFDLDVLIQRILDHKVQQWSRIGRLRRTNPPRSNSGVGGRDTFYGTLCSGRLLCDTYLAARELLGSETSYALTPLVKSRLGKDRVNVDPVDLPLYFKAGKDTLWLANHTENDAWLSLELMFALQVLPLTKQITNLAGNLWSRTLLGARAERIEYLFLHEFHRRKYIVPDKAPYGGKRNGEENEPVKGKSKAAYSGGLVLDPKKGLYDKYVIVLDFNSLYPSIIREYNICFTTVERTIEKQGEDATEPAVPPIPHSASSSDKGVLPSLIETLVKQRRSVKDTMKNATGTEYQQMDIRQKALKILANSMYGCLGFSHSRFFARSIAALVTSQGREILSNTVEVAEKKLGLDVIYGDTDSIMVNTNSSNYQDVIEMGSKVKREINKLYRLLEIDIEGVYAMMLLLKKKKYAALVADVDSKTGEMHYSKEYKGLDLVRRDWCVMSKLLGEKILDIVLNPGQAKEDIVTRIHDELTTLAESVRKGEMPMSEFVITRGLNKAPKDYPDAKSQPHLQVALRLLKDNKPVNVGDHIPYVVCKQTYSEFEELLNQAEETKKEAENAEESSKPKSTAKSKSPAERAFHPDEVERYSHILEIDYEWYLANQIHPPISRLCEPIEGTSSGQLAMCLGLDPSRFNSESHDYGSFDRSEDFKPGSILDDAERFVDAEHLVVVCTQCCKVQPFAGVRHSAETVEKAVQAGNRGKSFRCSGFICREPNCSGIVTGVPQEVTDKWFEVAQESPNKHPADIELYLDKSCLNQYLNPDWKEHKEFCTKLLLNSVRLCVRKHIKTHMQGWLVCDDYTCQLRTRNQPVDSNGTACPREGCTGKLQYEYPPKRLNDQLEYLKTLFDVEGQKKKAKAGEEPPALSTEDKKLYNGILKEIQWFLDASMYNVIDTKTTFGYMRKLEEQNKRKMAHAGNREAILSIKEESGGVEGGVLPLHAMTAI